MRLDVAVGVDLRAVGSYDGDRRGPVDGRIRLRGIVAEASDELAMPRGLDLFFKIAPVRSAVVERFEGLPELIF